LAVGEFALRLHGVTSRAGTDEAAIDVRGGAGRLRSALVRSGVLAAAGVLLTLVVVGLVVVSGGGVSAGPVSAGPVPRGGLVAVPQRPAVLDRSAVMKTVDGVRGAVAAAALTGSVCLDGVAGALAGAFDAGAVPGSAPSGCGRVEWGWVAGSDPTGRQQVRAVFGRTATGASPLIGPAAGRVGLALGPRRESGVLTGFVLVWVVAA
jgi:hypothetical protein